MNQFGLCCLFHKENIKFKTYTLTNIKKLLETQGIEFVSAKISDILNNNISQLQLAFNFCHLNNILSYRISSDLFPHISSIRTLLGNDFFQPFLLQLSTLNKYNLILSMHPGQHVNIGSPLSSVILSSVSDLKEHLEVANAIGCHEINFHIGGSYGNKESAKTRFIQNLLIHFTHEERQKLTIENDELNFTILEVVEVAMTLNIRATYDLHHERCFFIDSRNLIPEKQNFLSARKTWDGYGYQRLHISTPRDGFLSKSKSRPHHDYINPEDFPLWLTNYDDVHIDIEAKHKETSIQILRNQLLNLIKKPT